MKVHEFQAKEILRKHGVKTPSGVICESVEQASDAIDQLGGDVWAVKAQIHAGGRGKGGGVRVVESRKDALQAADDIIGNALVTPQTTAEGQIVRKVLIEQGIDIKSEIYAGLVVDRARQRVVLMTSSEGGMEIEEVAERAPDKIHKTHIDPGIGLTRDSASEAAQAVGITEDAIDRAVAFLIALYEAFWDSDASLAEINPLVITAQHDVIALDAKMAFDESALYRQPDIVACRDLSEESQDEIDAADAGLSYIPLDGNIGCLVNGAGLAMATMDIIKLYGGRPANFLDVGGGATKEQVIAAFRIMLRNEHIKAVLVNIFGGIMRCDVIAAGLVAAFKEIKADIPVVVRLEGTNVEIGRQILQQSGLALTSAATMDVAAEKVVAASRA